MGQKDDALPDGADSQEVSRRSLIVRGISAIALSSAAALSKPCTALGVEILPVGSESGPTSEDAEIVTWGQSPSAGPNGNGTLFVSRTIRLAGDWCHTKLVAGLAWGNGHDNCDVWASYPKLAPGKAYKLGFTGILPHPRAPGEWYFTVMLEVGDSKSDRISAMFRYTRYRGADGVLSVSFPFPAGMGFVAEE